MQMSTACVSVFASKRMNFQSKASNRNNQQFNVTKRRNDDDDNDDDDDEYATGVT